MNDQDLLVGLEPFRYRELRQPIVGTDPSIAHCFLAAVQVLRRGINPYDRRAVEAAISGTLGAAPPPMVTLCVLLLARTCSVDVEPSDPPLGGILVGRPDIAKPVPTMVATEEVEPVQATPVPVRTGLDEQLIAARQAEAAARHVASRHTAEPIAPIRPLVAPAGARRQVATDETLQRIVAAEEAQRLAVRMATDVEQRAAARAPAKSAITAPSMAPAVPTR
jgi:hypothetical protein